jgi:hypothetical protein
MYNNKNIIYFSEALYDASHLCIETKEPPMVQEVIDLSNSSTEVGDTRIEVYGVCRRTLENVSASSMPRDGEEGRIEAELAVERGEETFMAIIEPGRDITNPDWRAAIKFGVWKDRPVCPGCGGKVDGDRFGQGWVTD